MSVGKRIESFRQRKEMSVDELAKVAGVKTQVLEAIEREDVFPAIGVLIKLARALGQRLGSFMDDQFKEDPLVVLKAERDRRRQSIGSNANPYEYYSLGQGKPDRHMEPFYVIIGPNEMPLSSHEGEEFIYVIKGRLELRCGNKVQVLEAGDSVYYNSLLPHVLKSVGPDSAEIVATVFTPF